MSCIFDYQWLLMVIKSLCVILVFISVYTELSHLFKDTICRIVARMSMGVSAAIMFDGCERAISTDFMAIVALMLASFVLYRLIELGQTVYQHWSKV